MDLKRHELPGEFRVLHRDVERSMDAKKVLLGLAAIAAACGVGVYLTRQEPAGAEETPTEAPAAPEVRVGII